VRQFKWIASPLVLAGLVLVAGCAGKVKTTRFLHPEFDFSYVERVAVLPFENLSADRNAGARASRLAVTELLATGAVDVVEPGEVRAALGRIPGAQSGRVVIPSSEQVATLGQELHVQGLIMGTVTQSEVIRSGAVGMPVVTLDMRMVETDTGETIWASTHTEKGSTVSAKVLGTGGEPISQTTRRCVKTLIRGLIR
jgi:TolB-like protein